MNDLAKLELTKDSFLYSIHQTYEARMKPNGDFNSHLQFEPFLEKTWTLPVNSNIHTLKKTMSEICEHHVQVLPQYRREESVNLENVAWFSHSIAVLFADLERVLMAYTGQGFPLLRESKIPRTNSSKNIAAAIAKFADYKIQESQESPFSLFPLLNENTENLDDFYTEEIWSLAFYFIKKFFQNYSNLMTLYATWKYVKKTESTHVVDWNVRPPCGDTYRTQFKHLFEKDYSKGRNSGKNGNNAYNGKNNTSSEQKFEDKSQAPSSFKPRSTDENGGSQFKPRSSDEQTPSKFKPRSSDDKENFRGKDKKFSSRPRENREERGDQTEIIEKAVKEAILAVKKMQNNLELTEFSLNPQNSFIRRQQHVVISEAGFETESRGEQEERCVCIVRK